MVETDPCIVEGGTTAPLYDLLDEFSHDRGADEHSVTDIVDAMRCHLGMDVAFVSEIADDIRVVRVVSGCNAPRVGRRDRASETLCGAVLRGDLPEYSNDLTELPQAFDIPSVRELAPAAYIEVPVTLPDGSFYGTFCCYSYSPHHSLDDRDLALMRVVAGLLGRRIMRWRQADAEAAAFRKLLGATISGARIELAAQPIVQTEPRATFAQELLARFPAFSGRGPGEVLETARRIAPGSGLDLLVLRRALSLVERAPEDRLFFVNISPDLLLDSAYVEVLEQAPRRIVVEMIEDETRVGTPMLQEAAQRMRSVGHAVALDDIGTGLSNLARLVEVRPDYLKLDRSLVTGIQSDEGRRALIDAFVRFSGVVGGQVIAEGVEQEDEWTALQALHVPFAQGFYLGRPEMQAFADAPQSH